MVMDPTAHENDLHFQAAMGKAWQDNIAKLRPIEAYRHITQIHRLTLEASEHVIGRSNVAKLDEVMLNIRRLTQRTI